MKEKKELIQIDASNASAVVIHHVVIHIDKEDILVSFLLFSKGDTWIILVFAGVVCDRGKYDSVIWVIFIWANTSINLLSMAQMKMTQMTEAYSVDLSCCNWL